jgi:hypothetical protein
MKFLNGCVNRRGPISVLCRRICCESAQAGFDPTLWLFAVAIRGASRIVRRCKPVRPTITNSRYTAVSSRIAAVGRADCFVP